MLTLNRSHPAKITRHPHVRCPASRGQVTSLASGREWWDVYDKKGTSEVDRARTELTAALLAGDGVLQAEGTVMDFLSATDGDDVAPPDASDPTETPATGKTSTSVAKDKTDKQAEVGRVFDITSFFMHGIVVL